MMIRPVKCCVCDGQLYYSDDKRFEPEVAITDKRGDTKFAHKKCVKIIEGKKVKK